MPDLLAKNIYAVKAHHPKRGPKIEKKGKRPAGGGRGGVGSFEKNGG